MTHAAEDDRPVEAFLRVERGAPRALEDGQPEQHRARNVEDQQQTAAAPSISSVSVTGGSAGNGAA